MTVSLSRFTRGPGPAELTAVAVVVLLVLVGLVLLVSPGPRWLARVEQRLTSEVRTTSLRHLAALAFGRGRALGVSACASVAVVASVVGPRSDDVAVVLLLVAVALLIVSRAPHKAGTGAALSLSAQSLAVVMAIPLALAGVALLEGAAHVEELARAQGGLPWEAEVVRRPAAALLAALSLVALVSVARIRPADARAGGGLMARDGRGGPSTPRDTAERLGLFIAATLVAIAFFGGASVRVGAEADGGAARIASAVLLFAKAWSIVFAVTVAARIASPWTGSRALAFGLLRLLPASVVGVALAFSSRHLGVAGALEAAAGAALASLAFVVAVRAVVRVRDALVRPEAHASPFL